MPVEKSAGAVIFRMEGGKPLFLLLQYPSSSRSKKSYWDLPKGHIEKGESEIDTVKREVKEETGLEDIKIVEGFRKVIKYFFKFNQSGILKFVTFFLAETKTKQIKISSEHVGFEWLPYDGALLKLTFKNAKDILGEAHDFISEKGLSDC